MINKQEYEAGTRCKGICDYGHDIKCSYIDYCYQYHIENSNKDKEEDNLLYKLVEFKGRVFNCTIDFNERSLTVYDIKYNNTVKYPLYSDNLVNECKDAVLRVYNMNINSEYVEAFNKWDGTFEGDDC